MINYYLTLLKIWEYEKIMMDLDDRILTDANPQLNNYYIHDIQKHDYYTDFEFTPDNVYNGLKAGPWIKPDYIGEKQINETLRDNSVSIGFVICLIIIIIMSITGINIIKGNPFKGVLIMFALSMIISVIIMAKRFFHYKKTKYRLDNAVLIRTNKLMESCGLERMQYKPDYITVHSDRSFRLDRTTYGIDYIIFNNNDDKKWYCVYNAEPSSKTVECSHGLLIKEHANITVNKYEIIIIETCRGQARLLVPDEPVVSYTIADGMGSLPVEETIMYDTHGSMAWLTDSFNDLNKNGIEDDRENKHKNLIGMVNKNKKDATSFTL